MELKQIADLAGRIRGNMEKVIVGKSGEVELIVCALLAGGHVLLDDVPGTGKTVTAKSLARSVAADFSRIQFTPDLLPGDVTGMSVYNQKEAAFALHPYSGVGLLSSEHLFHKKLVAWGMCARLWCIYTVEHYSAI